MTADAYSYLSHPSVSLTEKFPFPQGCVQDRALI
jgi:hypothetical protein